MSKCNSIFRFRSFISLLSQLLSVEPNQLVFDFSIMNYETKCRTTGKNYGFVNHIRSNELVPSISHRNLSYAATCFLKIIWKITDNTETILHLF